MMGYLDLQRVNERAATELAEAKNPKKTESQPPVLGNVVLVVYTTSHNKTSRTYVGRTGGFMHDKALVNGWSEEEIGDALTAADRLQQFVGLDSKVAVDRK